jgi:hypothetical protein
MEVIRLMLRFRIPVVLVVLLLSWTSGCHCGPSLPGCGEVYLCSWKSESSCCRTNSWKDLVYNPMAAIFGGHPGPCGRASCCGGPSNCSEGYRSSCCEDINCKCNRTGDSDDSDSPPIQNDVEADGPPEPGEDLLPHPVQVEFDGPPELSQDVLPQTAQVELDAPVELSQDVLPKPAQVELDEPAEPSRDLFLQPVQNESIEEDRSLFRPLVSRLLGG